MKFPCDNCQARYQIADEKVGDRTLRMKCRRCGHSILIRGSASKAPASAPVPTASASPPLSDPPRSGRTEDSQVGRLPRGRSGSDDSGVGPLPVRSSTRPDEPAPPRPRPPSVSPPTSLDEPPIWHVSIHDVPVGPITRDEVAIKIVAGALLPDSLCWREGFDDWLELSEIPELAELIPARRSEPAAAAKPPPLPGKRGASPSDAAPPVFSVLPSDVASIAPSEMPPAVLSEGPRISADALSGLPGSIPKASALPMDLFDTVTAPSDPGPPMPPMGETAPMLAFAGDANVSVPPPGTSLLPPPRRAGLTTGAWVGLIVLLLVVGIAALVFGRQWLGVSSDEANAPPAAASRGTGVFHAERLNFELPQDLDVEGAEGAAEGPAPEQEAAPAEEAVNVAPTPTTMRQTRLQQRTRAASTMSASATTTATATASATMTTSTSAAPTPMRELTAAERAQLERFAASSEASPDAIRGSSPDPAGSANGEQEALRPLGEADIRRVVGQNQPSLQRCYESAARGRLDSPSARLDVDVVVGTSGAVTRATARGQGFGDLSSCVERAVRRWRFPRSQGGQTRFPVVFHGN